MCGAAPGRTGVRRLCSFALVSIALAACAPASATTRTETPEPKVAESAEAGAGEPDDQEPCEVDDHGLRDACSRVPRHGRPNRVYPNETAELERLLEKTPPGLEHDRILARLSAEYLELACLALRECMTAELNGASRPAGVRRISREAYAKHLARCAMLQLDSPDAGALGLCR